MEALFIRHGQAESNTAPPEKGVVGSDLNLTPEGMRQALAAADRLGKLALEGAVTLPGKIYSSWYKRAQQTARIIAEVLDLPIVTEDALKEIQKGDWHGMRVLDVMKLESDINQEDKLTFRPPEGENPYDVADRMINFIEQLEESGEHSILIVSHNHPIESAIGRLTGQPISKWKDRPVDNASITRLYKNDDFWEIDEDLYNLKTY